MLSGVQARGPGIGVRAEVDLLRPMVCCCFEMDALENGI